MSTTNAAATRGATVEGFVDAMPYDPFFQHEDHMTEETRAHYIGSNSHSPNPTSSSGFSPPPQDTMGGSDEPMSGTVPHRDSELFEFARIDSGFRVGSGFSQFGAAWENDATGEDFANTRVPGDDIVSNDNIDPPSRKSSGLATVSAHSNLLSPTLTNSTLSPTSPHAGQFGRETYRQLGGGEEMTRNSSMSTDQMTNVTGKMHFQYTPMSKAQSSHSSPEPPNSNRLTSPIVRVSRHDSPARPELPQLNTGKRSHEDEGLLAPEHAFQSVEVDEEPEFGRGRTGLSPSARPEDDVIPSINEEAEARDITKKNLRVESWAMKNANPDIGYLDPNNIPGGVRQILGGRARAKSTSKNSRQLRHDAFSSGQTRREARDRSTPGPNALIDEDSGDDDDDDDAGSSQESAPADVDAREEVTSPFGHFDPEDRPLDGFPWVDPIYLPSRPGDKSQPPTANAAIARFRQRNADIETASRAATWGTRRMSDSTLDQVLGDKGLFSRLKLTSSKDKDDGQDEARSSLQEGVAHIKQVYRTLRSNSTSRRKVSDVDRPMSKPVRTDTYARPPSPGSRSRRPSHESRESSASLEKMFSRSPSQRQRTVSRPTTPRLNTGALAAITTAGLGMPGISATSPTGPTSPSHHIKEGFKRLREGLSRHFSEDSQGSSNSGLADMMKKSGGPPVASVGNLSPPAADDDAHSESRTVKAHDDDEDAQTTIVDPEKGVKMPMSPQKDLIIPNFDGFKTNVRDVNPRLDEWLVERLGQEQLRRYKRLVEYKIQHLRHVQAQTCPSKDYCAAGGNFKRYFQLPKSAAHKDSVGSADAEVPLDALDEDEQAIAEGAVSEAQFPPGLPMPPVERLPAEFECPFCFQVKKFTKPSDWSKHVHEDLQPFTCTFKHCSDPKSFKRKADWVRHENERHRQLEWWECTEEGCQHRCYRRDNFVQHLIREHKLPEPPNKPTKQPNKPAVRGPAKSKGRGRGNTVNINDVPLEEKVLLMVETCRHETSKSANEEKCRFCGNVCNSWKKLTVHLARHMEQLSIPVLDLVDRREVHPDTIISPLEQRPPMALTPSPVEQHPAMQPGDYSMGMNPPRTGMANAGGTNVHVNFMSTQPDMNPSMFVPAPMSGFVPNPPHPYVPSQFHNAPPGFYDLPARQQQQYMHQLATAGATNYPVTPNQNQYGQNGNGAGAVSGMQGQGQGFNNDMFLNENAFDQQSMDQWSTHAGNPQYGGMPVNVGFATQQAATAGVHNGQHQGQHQQQYYNNNQWQQQF